MEAFVSPRSNRLLGLLPEDALRLLKPHLELKRFAAGTILHQPHHVLRHALFPVSGLLGCVAMTAEGRSTELALSGRDRMTGANICLRGRPTITQTVVLVDTTAFAIAAPAMLAAWRSNDAFQWLLLRYVHATLGELIQVALCNKHHTLEQQLSRWLLMCTDRLGHPTMRATHAVIANMLGVRREGVTQATGRLEALGILNRDRDGMHIVDRPALLARACGCYSAMSRCYDALTSDATSAPTENGASVDRR